MNHYVRTALLFGMLASGLAYGASPGHAPAKSDNLATLPACQGVESLPSPDCGRVPTPAVGPDGRLWLAFVRNGHVYVTHAANAKVDFASPVAVNVVPEAIYSDGENRPRIAFGQQREVYVSWVLKTPGRYSGDVRFARSLDGGLRFQLPITVHDDRQLISHRFNAMVADDAGHIHMVWIDKRDQAAAKAQGADYAGAALYYAVSEDRGEHFSANRKVVDQSCECCRVAVELDGDDTLVTLWRHIFPGSIRDHAITRLSTVSRLMNVTPMRATFDDWQMDGCPHHGPDMALDGDDRVHMAWFSGGGKQRGLFYGQFDMVSQKLSHEFALDTASGAARPQVLAVDGKVYTAWKTFDGSDTELRWRVSHDGGRSWSAPQVLASAEHTSDHPILMAYRDGVYVSWHSTAEGYRLLEIDNTRMAGSDE